jgi:ABC-type lipoprotein release transport system permease subunit
MLYGIQPHDIPTFVFVPSLLLAAALAAAAWPAWRASRLDPLECLR